MKEPRLQATYTLQNHPEDYERKIRQGCNDQQTHATQERTALQVRDRREMRMVM